MRNLPKIIRIFHKSGRGNTPVAVIQQGSLPEEKIALGTIDSIVKEVNRKELTNPVLILIGEVVRLHPKYPHKTNLTLIVSHKTILCRYYQVIQSGG